jgi:hypothetical protein
MKGRIQWMLWILLAVAVGCHDEDIKGRIRQRKEAERMLEQYKANMKEKTRALKEQLERGLQPVVDCALEKFRKDAEMKYGTAAVKQAKITADAPRRLMAGEGKTGRPDDRWEVPIRYVGKDEKGKDVDEQWVTQVVMMLGSLDCVMIKKK